MNPDSSNRSVLPIHERRHVGLTTYDPDTAYPPISSVRPPAGAPNVLIVLLDDIGFGASATFGSAHQNASIPMLYSADETLDLGADTGTSVSDDYDPETSYFTGAVNWVQLDQGDDDSHLITPEERLRVAMSRQ